MTLNNGSLGVRFWNERYAGSDFVYGTEPNAFFKEVLDGLKPGALLMPCEGEGRNAVYAARKGWMVSAFDQSDAGKKKALSLAQRHHVAMDYRIEDAGKVEYPHESFDVIAFSYAHFPMDVRRSLHRRLAAFLRTGGLIIIEGFSKLQPEYQRRYQSGGPQDPGMLYDSDDLLEDFIGFEVIQNETKEVELHEGAFHEGTAHVVRMLLRKR